MKDNKLEVGDVIYGVTRGGLVRDRLIIEKIDSRYATAHNGWKFRVTVNRGLAHKFRAPKHNSVMYRLETEELAVKYEQCRIAYKLDMVFWRELPVEKLKAVLAVLEAPDGK